MSDAVRSVDHMIIECELCETRPDVAHDCMVAFLTDPERKRAPVHMDAAQAAAVEFMVKGGLIPPLHLVPPLQEPAPTPRLRPVSTGRMSRVS